VNVPDVSLASVSNHLFAAAVVVYAVAMFAFAFHFAFGRRPATVPAYALPEPVLVGAGGPPPLPAPPAAPATLERRAGKFARIGLSLTVLGVLLHIAEVTTRGVAVGRPPWGNMYEFSSMVGLVAVVAYLLLLTRQPKLRDVGLFVLLPVVLYLGLAGTVLYAPAGPLQPALNSYWLKIHVTAAITATGALMVTGVVSCLHLIRRRHDARIAAGGRVGRLALAARLPAAAALDRAEYRVISFAFPVFTFAIIAGAIWAESAWGRYWGWDPKETWSFITWVIYAAYLHARSVRSWRPIAPMIAMVGFGALLFNYYFINLVVSGLHSYAGV
jgi:cytochrome c-type biogenesis protein CcsB